MLTGQAVWPFRIPCMHLKGVLLTCRIAQLLDVPGLRREASNLAPKLIAVLQPVLAAGNCVHTVLRPNCTLYAIYMRFGLALSYCGASPSAPLYTSQLHCCCYCLDHQKKHKGLLSPKKSPQIPIYGVSSLNASFTHMNRSEPPQHCICTFSLQV